MDAKEKRKCFFDTTNHLKERIEQWMGTEEKMKVITDTILSVIPYYATLCFYMRKSHDSFQIGPSGKGLLPHRVEDESICGISLLKKEDMISAESPEFSSEIKSQISVLIFDMKMEMPEPFAVFYGVSDKPAAFENSDISFIRDISERFLE